MIHIYNKRWLPGCIHGLCVLGCHHPATSTARRHNDHPSQGGQQAGSGQPAEEAAKYLKVARGEALRDDESWDRRPPWADPRGSQGAGGGGGGGQAATVG